MEAKLNPAIFLYDEPRRKHLKASEEYVHVRFTYADNTSWDGWVPVEYRRTGVSIKEGDNEKLYSYLNRVYEQMDPQKFPSWLAAQEKFWKEEKPGADTTKAFFDSLIKGGWQCVACALPNNPNWARRIQDLKEFGYTIATDTKRFCPVCKQNKTHLLLLPIERISIEGNGYESFSPTLRNRIIKVLGGIDAYEGTPSAHCLPDHKFSEIRWDENTKSENPDTMSEADIRAKFQLLSNQRNQQKREVCRNCFQTGKRGVVYGIPFYYKGNENWNENIPTKGKEAEEGCEGCPWYDLNEWKRQVLIRLNSTIDNKK